MIIRDIIELQKREIDSLLKERYIERVEPNINLSNSLIKVIIGPRRAGKSFFSIYTLSKNNKFGYINFDDEELTRVEDYNELISAVNSVYGTPKILFFDEIQNLPRWELFINRLQRQGHILVVTGSNSHLLSKELATHLTGRHFQIIVFPFSFKEYLNFEKKNLTTSEIKEKLNDYLIFGGYPEPLIKKINYKEYLSTLLNSILFKDIVKRYKIRYAQAISDLSEQLLSNIANEYSYNSLSKISKIKSTHTVEKYIKYLEESFIFFSVKRFSYKMKEQISSIKKIYCIDNGFIHARAFNSSQNIGKLYENVVAVELKKQELNGKINFYYWKNQQQEEVDFVVKEGIKIKQLIQVCYNLKGAETKNREVRSLLKAGNELKCKNLLVINSDKEGEEEIEWFGIKAKVKFTPLWKWLLEEK
ncbi:MAG: ATP-binding protein [Nanoarchaeota archaeon]|nr:ATP-binding protein [Nanoarchaeota archaeon]